MSTVSPENNHKNSFEDKVILTTIIFSLLIAVLLFLLSTIPGTGTVVATFLGLGLAALVYRFLGGIGETSFQIRAWKIAGTGAFLIGTIWFIDSRLQTEVQWHPARNTAQWFAIDNHGIPLQVDVGGVGSISKPKADVLAKNQLSMQKSGDGYLVNADFDSASFTHGYISKENLSALNLSNDFSLSVLPGKFVITDSLLRPYTKFYNLDPLPFYISTGRYGGEYSRFSLHNKEGKQLYQGQIRGRGAEIIQVDGAFYFVAVTMVNHELPDINDKYAKFAFAELELKTALK
ncbi:MAG: hypothetical protein H6696_15780 [Deferribacteres bacterium]|nr:hypothetical protein [candidate division KSB1 bacterium]MCB9503390.1 hypothetical protein [Deferribacteres bacterium]